MPNFEASVEQCQDALAAKRASSTKEQNMWDPRFLECVRRFVGDCSPEKAVAAAVARAADQIVADVEAGRVPADVASFAELHDHVDANAYGDAFSFPGPRGPADLPRQGDDPAEDRYLESFCRFWNEVQDTLDKWIRDGGLSERLRHRS